jgi:hypothetical protein
MSEEPPVTTAPQTSTPVAKDNRFRIGAVVVLALAAALILWLVLRDSGSESSTSSTTTAAHEATASEVNGLAASVGHPVFWLGPKSDSKYEVTQNKGGPIYIRYLPADAKIGVKDPYTTVATYPFPGAYKALQDSAKKAKVTPVPIADKGIVVPDKNYPPSVHVAYPGVDYQVEVFDPTAGAALQAVTTGQLVVIGSLEPTKTPPASQGTAAKTGDAGSVKAFAKTVGHPVYWAGTENGKTYEVSQTADGRVYVRYLPEGTAAGSSAYLTVATYPFPGAYGAIKALSGQSGMTAVKLPNGGLAVIDKNNPNNIHLAFQGSNYQIEVFDPSAARAKQVVQSGKIAEVQ